MQKHRCRKKSHLQSNNAPTSRLLTAFVLIMITLECSVTYFNQKLLTLIILYNTLKEKHNTHPNHLKHQTY